MNNRLNHNEKIPVPSDEVEKAIREINSKEQFYTIALFDVLGFSNFVEKNGYQAILNLYSKLVELIRKQESSPEGSESVVGSVAPIPQSSDWKNNFYFANTNGYIQAAHFSDTIILFVNYELSAPIFMLRTGYYEPHPLIVKERDSKFFIPFEEQHHIYISFLQTCMDFFCRAIMDSIPLRGVISSGTARMDPAQSIYFGSPLVEAGNGESAQNSLGVAFGRSFNNYHPIYNRYFMPYSRHIKKGEAKSNYLSRAVLDWPRHWRERYGEKDITGCINKMNRDPQYSHYYENALRFYEFSHQNSEWYDTVNCDGASDISDFYDRADKWLRETE